MRATARSAPRKQPRSTPPRQRHVGGSVARATGWVGARTGRRQPPSRTARARNVAGVVAARAAQGTTSKRPAALGIAAAGLAGVALARRRRAGAAHEPPAAEPVGAQAVAETPREGADLQKEAELARAEGAESSPDRGDPRP